jgi:EAL domain-containing protein (putative c-di-GMP-specific phosphodiesterase class I)
LGARVALDDFGAGFTSFRHVRTLRVDAVKIDGAVVRGIARNHDSQLFVRTLCQLAHDLDLATVAEGVEADEDEAFLKSEGVGYFQSNRYGAATIEAPWRRQA